MVIVRMHGELSKLKVVWKLVVCLPKVIFDRVRNVAAENLDSILESFRVLCHRESVTDYRSKIRLSGKLFVS